MNNLYTQQPPYIGQDQATGRYWHLGYGSNISYRKMRGNLFGVGSPNYPDPDDMNFPDGSTGTVPGYQLCVRNLTEFGKGTANIHPAADGTTKLYGVVYSLTLNQFRRMWDCEGANLATLIPAAVTLLDGTQVNASTWQFLLPDGKADCDPQAPVKRYYFELIAEAAAARGIPAQYIDEVFMRRVLERDKF